MSVDVKPDLAVMAVASPELLATMLQLPEGAYIDAVLSPPDMPGELHLRVRGAGHPVKPGMFLQHTRGRVSIDYTGLRDRLKQAVEGEIDGLAITDEKAMAILSYVIAESAPRGALYSIDWGFPESTP